MIYNILEWQRFLFGRLLEAARMPPDPSPLHRAFFALGEAAARTAAASEVNPTPIEDAVGHDAPWPIHPEIVEETPFVRVVRLRAPHGGRSRSLLIAPYSGYQTAVMSALVLALLEQGEVVVTDWKDARLVPLSEGRFDLAAQALFVARLVAAMGSGAHLVALSQSGPAALIATAIAAAHLAAGLPRSLILLGSQIDPRRSGTALQHTIGTLPRELVAAQLLATVPGSYPGAGRRVYPAVLQLLGYSLASAPTYLDVQRGLLSELAEGVSRGYARQHADMHCLADVPGELFLDMLDWVAYRPAVSDAGLSFQGESIDLAGLRGLPLLTIEAEADELVGPGQTHALHTLRGKGGPGDAVTIPHGLHHDLFVGPRFGAKVAPALSRFLAKLDR
ncbi:MAG: hypothetical protein U1E45_04035 [Geminicoccaceae bacterium]